MVEVAVRDQDGLKIQLLALDEARQPFRLSPRVDRAGTTLGVPHEIAVRLQWAHRYAKHVGHSADPTSLMDDGRCVTPKVYTGLQFYQSPNRGRNPLSIAA